MNNWDSIISIALATVATLAAVLGLPVVVYILAKLIGYGFTVGKKKAEFESKSLKSGESRNGS